LEFVAKREFTLECCCDEIGILSFKCNDKRSFVVDVRLDQVHMLERVRLEEVLQRLELFLG
jgi:hypothetical protein